MKAPDGQVTLLGLTGREEKGRSRAAPPPLGSVDVFVLGTLALCRSGTARRSSLHGALPTLPPVAHHPEATQDEQNHGARLRHSGGSTRTNQRRNIIESPGQELKDDRIGPSTDESRRGIIEEEQ